MSPCCSLVRPLAAALGSALAWGTVGCGSPDASSPSSESDASDDNSPQEAAPNEAGSDTSTDLANQDSSAADADASSPEDANPDTGELDGSSDIDASESLQDPAQDGPYSYVEIDGKAGSTDVHCAIPRAGPSAGPYPLVLFAHGFMIEPFRYYGYIQRLGTFGYVACTVAYNSFAGQDQDPVAIVGALDWAIAESAKPSGDLSGKVDATRAGVMGHSRGGKAAVNSAAADGRFLAVLGVDPVNTCPTGTCPDAIAALAGLAIPSAFLGETLDDGSGGGIAQACAPASDSFVKFYEAANAPSIKVDVLGANHMSFVDETTGCLQCGLCNAATAGPDTVHEIAHAFAVAFFERRLRGIAGYDTYLTGADADARYVQTNRVTIESK